MSSNELRMLVTAQIMAAMAANLTPNTPDAGIRERVELAVKIAVAIEEAVSKSPV
jgi:hypothetical protein